MRCYNFSFILLQKRRREQAISRERREPRLRSNRSDTSNANSLTVIIWHGCAATKLL